MKKQEREYHKHFQNPFYSLVAMKSNLYFVTRCQTFRSVCKVSCTEKKVFKQTSNLKWVSGHQNVHNRTLFDSSI